MDDRNQFGKLAQATFVQRALAQGLTVAEPFGNDQAFDYLAGIGRRFWRVQVKGSRAALYNNTYQVSVGHQTGVQPTRRAIPYTAEEIDLVAAWLFEEDSWYFIPVEIVDGRVGLSFHARNHSRFGRWRPYLENWDLLRQTGEMIVLPPDEPNAVSPRRTKGRRGGRGRVEQSFPRLSVSQHTQNQRVRRAIMIRMSAIVKPCQAPQTAVVTPVI